MKNRFFYLFILLMLNISFSIGQSSLEKDRVAYYKLDGTGDDDSKYKNNGEIIGTPNVIENRFDEKKAIQFDGDDWIMCGSNSVGIRDKVSISLWMKTTDSLTRISTIIGKYDREEARGFNVIMRKGKISIGGRDGELPPHKRNFRSSGNSKIQLADGNWHHIVGTINKNIWSIWIDGKLESKRTFDISNPNLRNNAFFVIGKASFASQQSDQFKGFNGILDDLMVYNRVLTEEEIQTLSNDDYVSSGANSLADRLMKQAFKKEIMEQKDSAIVLLEKSSVLFQKLKNDERQSLTLALLSRYYLDQGDLANAIEHNLKSLFISSQMSNDDERKNDLIILAKHNIAKINLFENKIDEAKKSIDLIEKEIQGKEDFYFDEKIKILMTKSEILLKEKEYQKSILVSKQIEDLFLTKKNKNKKLIALNQINYGRALLQINKVREGIKEINEAGSVFQIFDQGKNIHFIQCLKYLAEAFQLLNNKKRSLEFIQTAIIKNTFDFQKTSFAENPNPNDFVNNREAVHLLNLKAAYLYDFSKSNPSDTSSLIVALRTCYVANELLSSINDELNVLEGPRMEVRQKFIEVYKNGIQIAHELYQKTKNEYYAYQAFYFSEMSKNFLLLEAVLSNLAKSEKALSEELLQEERELRQNYFDDFEYFADLQSNFFLSNLSFSEDLSAIRAEEKNRMSVSRKALQEFNYKLQNEYLDFQNLRTQPIIAPLKEVQEKLDAKEIIVEYSIFEKTNSLYVFLISKNDLKIKKLNWSKESNQQIQELYQLLQDPVELQLFGKETYESLSFELYKKLIFPINSNLTMYSRIKLIPEGMLNYVPFEALLTTQKSGNFAELDYLINRFQISYHYSTTLLNVLESKKAAKENRSFFGFAPISFSKKSKLVDLKASKEEVETIASIFQQKTFGSVLRSGNEASIDELKDNFRKEHQIFHIASHTLADIKYPLYSKIACSDGEVNISELFNLKLKADLLVLSSCKSGVGKLIEGEGMQGLNRNFIAEGVPNIIFTLWEAYDEVTKDLMIEFYKQILSGKDYDEALQKSKLKIIQQKDVVPTFWAAFILVGE